MDEPRPSSAPTLDEVLALVRQRRDHFRDLYFKMEDRAQFFAGVQLAAGAALLSIVKTHLIDRATSGGALSGVLFVLVVVALILQLISLLGVFMTLSPLRARTLFDGQGVQWLEGRTLWLARIPERWSKPREAYLKPKLSGEEIRQFLGSLFKSSVSIFPPPGSSPIFDDEVHNLWAQWFVYMRRALLLRKTVFVTTVALLFTGLAYLSSPSASGEPAASTPTATRANPQEEARPPLPKQYNAQRPPQAWTGRRGDQGQPGQPSTMSPPAAGSPAQAPASAPSVPSSGSP